MSLPPARWPSAPAARLVQSGKREEIGILRLLGDVAARQEVRDVLAAEEALQAALDSAESIGLRPSATHQLDLAGRATPEQARGSPRAARVRSPCAPCPREPCADTRNRLTAQFEIGGEPPRTRTENRRLEPASKPSGCWSASA
jgi:hypothetical protein